jgi:hypothetical protein
MVMPWLTHTPGKRNTHVRMWATCVSLMASLCPQLHMPHVHLHLPVRLNTCGLTCLGRECSTYGSLTGDEGDADLVYTPDKHLLFKEGVLMSVR